MRQRAYLVSRAQCYKTFNVRTIQLFAIARVFLLGRPFQPNIMFVSKTGAYLPLRCSTLGLAPGLTANIRLGLFYRYAARDKQSNIL
jgi:hypothetical protein